jgi:type II secretory pathway pseudopilin PulG
MKLRRAQTRHCSAFTMVEIAISLAVIGFALVAIIGILPLAMNVQKENREETIINQDANFWLDALRRGAAGMTNTIQGFTAQGLDDLTNYVYAITNYWTDYNVSSSGLTNWAQSNSIGYTYTSSSANPRFTITNGYRIIGLLSTPKYTPSPRNPLGFTSNHIVAFVRALSGVANEKFPQVNQSIEADAFSYRMIPEVIRYGGWDRDWINYTAYLNSRDTNDWVWRSNYWNYAKNLNTNLTDLRLTFRWPVLPNGNAGPGRQTFRVTTGGTLVPVAFGRQNLYFFQPQTYVQITRTNAP